LTPFQAPEDVDILEQQRRAAGDVSMQYQHAASSAMAEGMGGEEEMPFEGAEAVATVTRAQPKVGRNQPCPCGSGKKYKQCHGKL